MLIKKLYIDGFKNLSNCEIYPSNLIALTGCNGSGKSNFLEALEFLQSIIFGSDEDRNMIFKVGSTLRGAIWIPQIEEGIKKSGRLILEIEALINDGKKEWEFVYLLEIEFFPKNETDVIKHRKARILMESASFRLSGKRGQMKKIFSRDEKGNASFYFENLRKNQKFLTPQNISAIKAIQIREADKFSIHFPVLCSFQNSLNKLIVLRVNSEVALSQYNIYRENPLKGFVDNYKALKQIKNSRQVWDNFKRWLKILANIDDVIPLKFPSKLNEQGKDLNIESRNFIFVTQGNNMYSPESLSMGTKIIINILITVFSNIETNIPMIIEEPETYLHPKAIIDLIKLFREESGHRTILLSTHSPVLLNSLNPAEVILMRQVKGNFYTTVKISEIKDAVRTLERGFVSLGDLLQTNFTTDEENG